MAIIKKKELEKIILIGSIGTVFLILDHKLTITNRFKTVENILRNKKAILNKIVDLGCGPGSFGKIARKYTPHLIGIDADFNSLKLAQQEKIYDELIQTDITKFTPDETTDLVVLIEVIEHMDKDTGKELINKLSSVKHLIITTPSKFNKNSHHGNSFQLHISLWSEKEFQELGFKTTKITNGLLMTLMYGECIIATRGL